MITRSNGNHIVPYSITNTLSAMKRISEVIHNELRLGTCIGLKVTILKSEVYVAIRYTPAKIRSALQIF